MRKQEMNTKLCLENFIEREGPLGRPRHRWEDSITRNSVKNSLTLL
jgi:hypothetical protein